MAYGTLKVDNIIFTNGGVDQTVTISGIVGSISGDIVATGTIQGTTIIGTTLVSGATVTGDAGSFTVVTGVSAGFTTITGTTVTGTTANFNTGSFTSQISGATITGNTGQFTVLTGVTAGFTTVTGTTVTGTTANFATLSGTTITGNIGQFTSLNSASADFTTITGATITGTVGNFAAGSESAPAVSIGTTNNGIYSPGTNEVALSTNGTQRINIEADGDINIDSGGVFYDATNNRLAVGSTTPADKLSVAGSSATDFRALTLRNSDGTTGSAAVLTFEASAGTEGDTAAIASQIKGVRDGAGTNGGLEFWTSNSGTPYQRARIDSSGRLLVGTSSARSNLFNSSVGSNIFQVEKAADSAGISIVTNNNTSGTAYLALCRSKGTTNGSNTLVASGDVLGTLSFQGSDGTEFVDGARIEAYVDGTSGANDLPTRLVFSVTADGASSPTERMRIQANGLVLIGTQTAYASGITIGGGEIFSRITSDRALTLRRDTTDGTIAEFRRDATTVGTISVTTTATAYNTSSDYRLKENVTAVTDGITRLQQLKPSRFNFIADPGKTVDGFIAHEVQTIVPEAITGEKDAVDDEGNPVHQGIDQSKLVPLLTAALQEAIAEINVLKDRVTALEGA